MISSEECRQILNKRSACILIHDSITWGLLTFGVANTPVGWAISCGAVGGLLITAADHYTRPRYPKAHTALGALRGALAIAAPFMLLYRLDKLDPDLPEIPNYLCDAGVKCIPLQSPTETDLTDACPDPTTFPIERTDWCSLEGLNIYAKNLQAGIKTIVEGNREAIVSAKSDRDHLQHEQAGGITGAIFYALVSTATVVYQSTKKSCYRAFSWLCGGGAVASDEERQSLVGGRSESATPNASAIHKFGSHSTDGDEGNANQRSRTPSPRRSMDSDDIGD